MGKKRQIMGNICLASERNVIANMLSFTSVLTFQDDVRNMMNMAKIKVVIIVTITLQDIP